jgi:GH25 family lysozyme M1 (1,4-beta-N-acetylmuramidase)
MVFVRGIDVHPSYQTVTDWNKVAGFLGAGKGFVIQKATEHTTFRTSNMYYKTAKAKGLLVGGYHFFRPGKGSVTDQADWFVKWLRDAGWQRGRDLPPVLDLERDDGLSDATVRARAAVFLGRVDSTLGLGADPWRRTMIYMNADWRNRMNGLHNGRVLWLASWPTTYRNTWPIADSAKPDGAGIWQFVGGERTTLRVPGIREGTDLNVAWPADLRKMAPDFYNDGNEEDMPLTNADAELVARKVWEHRLNPGATADDLGGYPADQTYAAGDLLIGGDVGSREDRAARIAELARDTVQSQVIAGIRDAVNNAELSISDQDIVAMADRVTANLVSYAVPGDETP